MGRESPSSVQKKETIRQIYSIDLSHSKEIHTKHNDAIQSLDFDTSDKIYLLSGTYGSQICLYDLSRSILSDSISFDPLFTITKTSCQDGPQYGITCIQWYPMDTGIFFTASGDCRIRIWDTNNESILSSKRFYKHIYSIHMSNHDAHTLAIGTDDSLIQFMDIRSVTISQTLKGHQGSIQALKWHPTKEHLIVSGSSDGTIRLWDIRTYNSLCTFDKNATGMKKNQGKEISHTKPVLDLLFTPDGKHVVSTGKDHEIRLWDAEFGYNMFISYPSKRSESYRYRLAVSNDGNVVYRSSQRLIEAFDMKTGSWVNTLRGHYDSVTSCVFHPCLPQMYSGGMDKKILVWSPSIEKKKIQ